MTHSAGRFLAGSVVVPVLVALALSSFAEAAQRGGGGGGHAARGDGGQAARGGGHARQADHSRADARTNNVRNTSVNNVNVSRNVNVNVEGGGGCRNCGWDNDHPIATAAAVTATVAVTAAVVGSVVRSVPPGCVPVNYGGMVYQQCGGTWYQPQGSQYIVVNAPY